MKTKPKTKRRRVEGFKRKKSARSLMGGVRVEYTDGIYEGDIDENGKKHGKGEMRYSNGAIYDGEWKNDKQNGNGKYEFPKSQEYGTATYVGEFKDDEFNGYGEYTQTVKGNKNPYRNYRVKYQGGFENDVKNGMGFSHTSGISGGGTMYGEFKNDKLITGTGKRFNVNGEGWIEEGDFKNDKIVRGKRIWPNHNYYEGEFDENGDMHGKGTFLFKTGSKYDGEFKHSLREGFGVLTWNGNVYEGGFKNDLFHGKGKHTYPDGRFYEGIFENGKPYGTPQNQSTISRSFWGELGMKPNDYKRMK
jgi:hypothetical protein